MAAERLLRLLINSIPTLITYCDTNEIQLIVNDAYAAWFSKDKTTARLIGKHLSYLFGSIYEVVHKNVEFCLRGQVSILGKILQYIYIISQEIKF